MTVTEKKKRLLGLLNDLSKARIMVIGDVMADHYLWGEVERISPEAPVPVVHVQKDQTLLGGAANVVNNLRGLGCQVQLCGIVGNDEQGQRISEQLADLDVDDSCLLVVEDRHTTVKSRVIAHNQQVVRVDWEKSAPISRRHIRWMLERIEERLGELDGIIISDYGKGVVNKALLDGLRAKAVPAGVKIAVDPKIQNMRHYHGFYTMTPNHHESGQVLGMKLSNTDQDIHRAGKKIIKRYRLQSLVITRGEEGMSLFENGDHVTDIPTVAKEVYDVTGAGDTVIAALSCGLAVGGSLYEAAQIANFSAGVVIAEVGTAAVKAKRVAEAIRAAKDIR